MTPGSFSSLSPAAEGPKGGGASSRSGASHGDRGDEPPEVVTLVRQIVRQVVPRA